MGQHYNQNYTKKQIEEILQIIQNCINCNQYFISKNINRTENIEFTDNYNLSHAKQKDILLKIKLEDFCHSLQNTNLGYEHESLYVFCPQMILYDIKTGEELVDIYTKFNIIDSKKNKRVVVISFHKRNKQINYLFKE